MSGPFQPIPESTQVHVDRLIGTQIAGYEVLARTSEGRLGTLYRAQQAGTGKQVTIEVLRTGRSGDDEAAKAANAIKSSGIAKVTGFGELPDGRRYRVMELLEGQPLSQRGRLSPKETAQVLDQVALVLEAAHAWAIVHGSLGPSSVSVHEGKVKVFDFGLATAKLKPLDDLTALGALGFSLLAGEELRDTVPPPPSPAIPEALSDLLRDLMDGREPDATSLRRSLAQVSLGLDAPAPQPAPAPKKSRTGAIAAVAAVLLALVGGAVFFLWPADPVALEPEPSVTPEQTEAEIEALAEPPEPAPEEVARPGEPPRPPRPKVVRAVPSAKALYEQTSRLEAQLRKQARPGDDVEQALYVLNKQRLRLAGSPSLEDRKEVARQLAGWRRSYLRP